MLYDRFYHKQQQPHKKKKKKNKTKQNKKHTRTHFSCLIKFTMEHILLKHFKTNEASISNFTKLSIYGEIIRST